MQIFWGKKYSRWICLECGEVHQYIELYKRKRVESGMMADLYTVYEYKCPGSDVVRLSEDNAYKISGRIRGMSGQDD